MSKGQSGVQVVAKAAALLDHLAAERELTPAQLAELLAEPRSTVYRLLATLEALELVETTPRRTGYRLGLKLFRLGSAVVARFDERQAALPLMEQIHEETGETVFLCVLREQEAVCIERIDGQRVQSLALRLGGSLPLHAGAAPRVLLAYQPVEAWEKYFATGPLHAFTPNTPVRRSDLFRRLEDVRDLGYAVSDEDVTIGIAAIGAPIFSHQGDVRASLSLSGVRPEILGGNAEAMIERVVTAARDISRALGHRELEAVGDG
jgi:DNA-binding IclR family transcriptional regulator